MTLGDLAIFGGIAGLLAGSVWFIFRTEEKAPAKNTNTVDPKDIFARKVLRALEAKGVQGSYYDGGSYAIRTRDGGSIALKPGWEKVDGAMGEAMDPIAAAFVDGLDLEQSKPDSGAPRSASQAAAAGAEEGGKRFDFLQRMLAGFQTMEVEAEGHPEVFSIMVEGGVRMDLEQIYQEYQKLGSAEDRAAALANWVKSAASIKLTLPESWDEVADRVSPRAIHASYVGSMFLDKAITNHEAGKGLPTFPVASLGDGIFLEVVLVDSHVILPLGQWLGDWGVALNDALNKALSNFMDGSVPIQPLTNGLFKAAFGSDLDSNMLLMPTEFWTQLPFEGAPVVWVITPGAVVAGDADDQELPQKLVDAVTQFRAGQLGMMSYPLIRNEEGYWQRWQPSASAAGAAEMHALVRRMERATYDQQQEQVAEWLELSTEGDGPWVSKFLELRTPEGTSSAAAWMPQATVLPPVEQVLVVREDGSALMVPQRAFAQVLGDGLKPVENLLPVRFAVDHGVTDDEWAALQEHGSPMASMPERDQL